MSSNHWDGCPGGKVPNPGPLPDDDYYSTLRDLGLMCMVAFKQSCTFPTDLSPVAYCALALGVGSAIPIVTKLRGVAELDYAVRRVEGWLDRSREAEDLLHTHLSRRVSTSTIFSHVALLISTHTEATNS